MRMLLAITLCVTSAALAACSGTPTRDTAKPAEGPVAAPVHTKAGHDAAPASAPAPTASAPVAAATTASPPIGAAPPVAASPPRASEAPAAAALPKAPLPPPAPVSQANPPIKAPVAETAASVAAHHPASTKAAVPSKAAPTAAASASTSLSGQVVLDAAANQALSTEDMTDAVLYFRPDTQKRHAAPGEFLIYTHHKQFDPSLLVIPVGSTVKFPNQDEILHNVYSTTPGSTFDLGIYGNGGVGQYTFRKPGLVLVHCNVHEGMQANVLVLDTPYIARPKGDGSFDLSGLPSGSGKLMLWHPRAQRPVSVAVTLPTSDRPVLHIAVTRPRVPMHADKDGHAYRAAQP